MNKHVLTIHVNEFKTIPEQDFYFLMNINDFNQNLYKEYPPILSLLSEYSVLTMLSSYLACIFFQHLPTLHSCCCLFCCLLCYLQTMIFWFYFKNCIENSLCCYLCHILSKIFIKNIHPYITSIKKRLWFDLWPYNFI